MKTKLFILLFASLCFSQMTLAEEILITITANGVRTEYKLSTLGKIVLDDKYSEDPLFNVQLKGKGGMPDASRLYRKLQPKL